MSDPSDEPTQEPGSPRFVRQFALTRGRAVVARAYPLNTLVEAAVSADDTAGLQPEALQILRLCESAISIAEIGAHLGVHAGIARVLVGDLADDSYVRIGETEQDEAGPDLDSLEMLLHDLINH